MKKARTLFSRAILLLFMAVMIAGCIYRKNANKDTVLSNPKAVMELKNEIADSQNKETAALTVEETEVMVKAAEERREQELEVLVQERQNDFAFQRLSKQEQQVYTEILQSLLSYAEKTQLSTLDTKLIDKTFQCVMLDHPEIFYVDGYQYTEYSKNDTVEKVEFTGNYLYTEEEKKTRQAQIDAEVQKIIAAAPDSEDEYDTVKYLYDTLIQQTEYDIHAKDNQNICSVFLQKKSVCQGYAKAMQYLLQNLGIESVLVLGDVVTGEGHAWNLARVNDAWYYLDATWGDAFYRYSTQEDFITAAEEQKQEGLINYDYLLVTTQQISKTHWLDMPIQLPECRDMTDNYYVREGLYFTSFDEEKLHQVFALAAQKEERAVTMKFADPAVYEETMTLLLEEQRIFEFLQNSEMVAYTNNDAQCSLTFWL